MVEGLPGAVAEVGVFKGGSAKFMMKCLPSKEFWLFDTFEGNPVADAGGHKVGDFPAAHDDVAAYLADGCDNHTIVPGIFPESAEIYLTSDYSLEDEEFCLVHLDADNYEATLAGLKFFWPKLIQGGKFYIHDYDWHACPGVKQAIEEFLAGLPEGSVASTLIAVPSAVKYMAIVKLVTSLNEDDSDLPEAEDDELPETKVTIDGEEIEGQVGTIEGERAEGEPITNAMRKVDVLRECAWVRVESLVDVKAGEHFRMIEPDEVTFGDTWVASEDGYLNDDGIPAIDCEKLEAEKPLMECTDCGHPNDAGSTVCVECNGDNLVPIDYEGFKENPPTEDAATATAGDDPETLSVAEVVANTEESLKSPLEQIASGEAKVGRKTRDKTLKKKDE
jgi:hypothetical protein